MFFQERSASMQFGIIVIGLWCLCSSGVGQTATETSDLSVASVRAALASEHALIAAHPKDPTNYVNLAYTLTDAGIGEQARTAVAEATRVAPNSGFAFSAQGWVLHHNSIGVDYGSGFDYGGAVRAYRRSIELNPQDLDVRQSLANLLEYNREGVRYAPDAQLPLAIDAYRYVKQHQPVLQADVIDNLAIDLFYAGRYDDAIHELVGLPGTTEHLGIILASVAASKGSSASIAFSSPIEGDEQRRKDALNFAAVGLWNKRLYAQAADLLTASLPNANGTAISTKIQLFHNLKPFTSVNLPASDPRQPVQRLLEMTFTGNLNEESTKELLSHHSYTTDVTWSSVSNQDNALAGGLLALMKQTGLPRTVVADIVLGRMTVTALADSGLGTPVRVQVLGASPIQFFVVSEHGAWKIAANSRSSGEAGVQAVYLLKNGTPGSATALLDWRYSLLDHSQEASDPLSGELFTRLWAPTLAQYPDSNVALRLAGRSYGLVHDWPAWKALLARTLQTDPDDRSLLLESANEAEAEGDYVRARQAYQTILNGSLGTPSDSLMYAWLSLFENKPDEKALAAAQQATMNATRRSYASLLTLACLDAAQGNTADAHQELLEATASANLAQPDAAIWYGFGRIFEQYGVTDAAVSSYRRTVQMAVATDVDSLAPSGSSAAVLARKRLDQLSTK